MPLWINPQCVRVQTKAPLGWEPGPAQDIWPLTKPDAEDGDHTLSFSKNLTIPGCHGVDPAALVTEWNDPPEEGRRGYFFHSVCDASGTIQWLKAAERLMNTQPKIINHSLVFQEVVEAYLNSCVRTNVLFLSFQFAQLTWLMSDVKLQISEHRCSVWFSVCVFFFAPPPHHKKKHISKQFKNLYHAIRRCVFWIISEAICLCEQRLRTLSHTWEAKTCFSTTPLWSAQNFTGSFHFCY